MDEKRDKPVDGHWYELDLPTIVLPGHDGRVEIIPSALLYPSFGTDARNWVAILARVVTKNVQAQLQWDASIEEFNRLYDDLKNFPDNRTGFTFPSLCGGGVQIVVEPNGIHGWRVHCELQQEHDTDSHDQPSSSVRVSFRLNASEIQLARERTAEFLRTAGSLATG